jgi:TonB family protein
VKSLIRLMLWFCLSGLGGILGLSRDRPAAENAIWTNFAILVGFPLEGQASAGGVLLVPGSVIPLPAAGPEPDGATRREAIDKSLSFTKTVESLWNTFRLDPTRRPQKVMNAEARVGQIVNLPELDGSNIKVTASLINCNSSSAVFRVVFRQGEKTLADSRASVARGGRAVVGGTDGPAAPYFFLVIEAGSSDFDQSGVIKIKAEKENKEITAPVVLRKAPIRYPEEAKKNKTSGTVVLDLIVNQEGKVENVRAAETPDPYLAEAAIESVRQWIFSPARNSKGQPVKVMTTLTVNFRLK